MSTRQLITFDTTKWTKQHTIYAITLQLGKGVTEHTLNGFLGSLETKANTLPEPVALLARLIIPLCGLL